MWLVYYSLQLMHTLLEVTYRQQQLEWQWLPMGDKSTHNSATKFLQIVVRLGQWIITVVWFSLPFPVCCNLWLDIWCSNLAHTEQYLFIFYPSLLVPILYELHFLFPQGDIKRTAEERTKLLVLLSKDALDVILQASMCVLHVCGVHNTHCSPPHTQLLLLLWYSGCHAEGGMHRYPPPPTIKNSWCY